MEDKIKAAANAKSIPGEISKCLGAFVGTFGVLIIVLPVINLPKIEARLGGFFACIGGV